MRLNKQEKNIVNQYNFIYQKLYKFDKELLSLKTKMIKKNHLMIQDIILKYFKNDIKELNNLK